MTTLVRTKTISVVKGLLTSFFQVIAVHTFIVVWKGITTRSFLFPSLIVGATWMYTILYGAISMKVHNDPSNPFYQPTPVSDLCPNQAHSPFLIAF